MNKSASKPSGIPTGVEQRVLNKNSGDSRRPSGEKRRRNKLQSWKLSTVPKNK